MSRTTDWVLEQEANGTLIFNGKEYIKNNKEIKTISSKLKKKYAIIKTKKA